MGVVRTTDDYHTAVEARSKLTWHLMQGRITRQEMHELDDVFYGKWDATIAAAQRAVSIPPLPPGRYYGD